MSKVAPTVFYVICGILLGMYVPQAAGAVLLLCVTSELYAVFKVQVLRAGSIRVNHIWIGLPGLALSKGTFLGVPCQYGILPLYPFIDCTALDVKRRGGWSSSWWHLVGTLWGVFLSVVSLLTFVGLLASLAYWAWGYPGGRSVVEVSSVRSGPTIDGLTLEPGDQLTLVGSIRATDKKQLTSGWNQDVNIVFLRRGTFLPPIRYSAISVAIANGQIELANRPIKEGIRIRQVLANSAAFSQGLQEGDVLLNANARPVQSVNDLVAVVDAPRGSQMSLQVSRNGVILPPVEFYAHDDRYITLGLIVDPVLEVRPRPVRVKAVVPNGASALSGLVPGDILLGIDDSPIAGLADFQERTTHIGKSVSLKICRGRTILSIPLTPALAEGSDSSVGASLEEVPMASIGVRSALQQGFRFGWYSLSVPVQLATQVVIGLADPHGIYGVWSSFLSWGPPPLELGTQATRSWFEVRKDFVRLIPAFLLSAAVPFMVMLEYLCCIRMMVGGVPGRWLRLSATILICVVMGLVFHWLTIHDKHLLVFEFPSFDDRILTVRSLWRF